MELDVTEAAERLGVIPQRVRRLIAVGDLPARKVGGRWVLDAVDVEQFDRLDRLRGRPFSSRTAWGVLAAADDRPAPWLSPGECRVARSRLKESGLESLVPRLRARARLERWYVHAAGIDRLLADSAVVASGVSAAPQLGFDIVAMDQVEAYVAADASERLARDLHVDRSPGRPNAWIRVVEGLWPFQPDERRAWPAVVAIDLVDSPDERTHEAGLLALNHLAETPSP